uniref:Uncharacterized protein LOC104247331 n=1 Tax=Nicotiana sylvestris TaxID=4096 RepID=A0A1U7YS03_NICSY|nr:PREDICTED: uncharacterized protein LOC104247331 [Nicotiana sylvestris]
MIKSLSINVPLVEDLEQMPDYAKFMNDLVIEKMSMNCETIKLTYKVSAIVHSMAPKLEDLGVFTISCTIGSATLPKLFMILGQRPLGIIDDVLVPVDKFILPADFVIHHCEVDYAVPIILGRPFLAMGKALVDDEVEELTSWVETSVVMNVDDTLEVVLLNCDDEEIEGYVECVNALQGMSFDIENATTPPTKPSIEEPPILELNPLPSHLQD